MEETRSGGDEELIDGYLEGDPCAVARVDGWLERAASSYRRRLRDQWDDVLQDIRLEITRLLRDGRFRGESSLKTYLWRVASHTCLDRIRARNRWSYVEYDPEGSSDPDPVVQPPQERVWSAERDLLVRVLAQMSEDCRKLWGMVLAGLSYREMSRRTGVSEGALRVRVLRCRKKAVEVRAELEQGGLLSV